MHQNSIKKSLKRGMAMLLSLLLILGTISFSAFTEVKAAGAGDVDLVDLGAITVAKFEVKPKGDTAFSELSEIADKDVYVGDEVRITFTYSELTDATAQKIYFISVPDGLNAIETMSSGNILQNKEAIGRYWVEDGKIKLQFEEEYLNQNGNTIDEGNVQLMATIDESAVTNNGEIMLGGNKIGTIPVKKNPDVTKITVKKWNGDGQTEGAGLDYDPNEKAVRYTFQVTADAGNNKTIDSIDVTDTLTTTVNGTADPSVVDGDYKGISITPADSGAAFTKQNGKYVLHAENVQAGTTITVSYWVPVKEDTVQAQFTNEINASKTVGGTTTDAGSDSVQGTISNNLQINKSAADPVFHTEDGTTTVSYSIEVTAPASNTTAIAGAYVEDIFTNGGTWVQSIKDFSTADAEVTCGELTTGANANFKVQLGTMAPGTTKTYTYTAVLDSSKCYMSNDKEERWLDNWAYAKAGEFTFNKSKGTKSFSKKFTEKEGVYDPEIGAYKFTIVFDGTIPGHKSTSDPADYLDGVLEYLEDDIVTKGKGYTYLGTPAPVLEAYRGPEGTAADAAHTVTLNGSLIAGQESFKIAIPQELKGPYSYRLTYYVNLPANAQKEEVLSNTYKVVVKGIGPGDNRDLTFTSSSQVSASQSLNNTFTKALDDYIKSAAGHEGEYAEQYYKINITSPIAAGAEITDTITSPENNTMDMIVPIDYLKKNLKITQAGKTLTPDTDYELKTVEGGADHSFTITFKKAIQNASKTNPVVISYSGQIVATENGKTVADTVNGINNLTISAINNKAVFTNGGLSAEKSVDLSATGKITKKAVDPETLQGAAGNDLIWDIQLSTSGQYSAFGKGYHHLVDTIPADQELLKVEYFVDSETPKLCPEDTDLAREHSFTSVVNEDGTTTLTINAYSGHHNHPETYRIWTRIRDDVLTEEGLNPDDFDDRQFTNSAYYEANGTAWKVAADQSVSVHRFDKEVEYGGTTEGQGGVKFILKVNTDKAVLNEGGDTITVHDVMNPLLALKVDSLRINGKTIDQIPKASLEYTKDSNQFDLILPDADAFEVTYIAEIDAAEGDTGWLSNEASIDGRADTVKVEDLQTARLAVEANASSKLAYFLKKTDAEGNLLNGAAFTIAHVTGVDTTEEAAAMTDLGNGVFKYRGVQKNSIYVVKETETPEGYKTCDPIYIVFGAPDQELASALGEKGVQLQIAAIGGGSDLDGMFTVKNQIETIDIPVNKVWEDNQDAFGNRPDSVTINLLADGVKVAEHEVVERESDNGDDWSYTFTDQPKYKTVKDEETGEIRLEEITYTITEEPVEGYISSVSNYTVTNTALTPAELAIPVLKKIEGDKPDADSEFEFALEPEGNEPMPENGGETITITGEGTGAFGALVFTKAGTYTYTVTETKGSEAGYTYDESEHKVIVTVTAKEGALKAAWTVDGESAENGIVFVNTYSKEQPGGGETEPSGEETKPGGGETEPSGEETKPGGEGTTPGGQAGGKNPAAGTGSAAPITPVTGGIKTGESNEIVLLAVLMLLAAVGIGIELHRKKSEKS